MNDPAAAAEHLKLIRGMMERATVYRAISAPAAIFGGLMACVTGAYFIARSNAGHAIGGAEFFWSWIAVLALVVTFNTALLWRKARQSGESMFTPAMKHVSLAFAPAMLVGGALSYEALVRYNGEFELGVLVWVLCYGVALLAMGAAAPRSLRRLGRMFLGAGLVIFAIWGEYGAAIAPNIGIGEVQAASWIMIATFGLLHFVHGAGVLLRKAKGEGEEELL